MESMYIGSGDIHSLMMGKSTDGHAKLLRKFVSGEKPHYNAKASPIDALRTGAILEERYFLTLDDDYYCQFKAQCNEMDVFRCSIDFAKIDCGVCVDFDELKTCNFTDFLEFEPLKNDYDNALKFIKKYYKANYYQVQQQLLCTGLPAANLVFLAVYSYDDAENEMREIKSNEFIKFRIFRDEPVISQIKEAGKIFQTIKDYYCK